METSLNDFVNNSVVAGRSSGPAVVLNRDGDFLTVFFAQDDAYSKRIDDLVTLYYSEASDELVGCKIKGVNRLVKKLGSLGVCIDHHPISVSLLFCSSFDEFDKENLHHYKLLNGPLAGVL